jgi:hypothetical protein
METAGEIADLLMVLAGRGWFMACVRTCRLTHIDAASMLPIKGAIRYPEFVASLRLRKKEAPSNWSSSRRRQLSGEFTDSHPTASIAAVVVWRTDVNRM